MATLAQRSLNTACLCARTQLHYTRGCTFLTRGLATITSTRRPKAEGTISDVFTSLTGEKTAALPPRFAELKRELWKDELVESWRQVLNELEITTKEVIDKGAAIIPRISYENLRNGLSEEQIKSVRKTGVIIITGGVPQEEALKWKQDIKDYAAANKDCVRGFPPDNIQVYEMYNSKSQIRARTHPALVNSQQFLLSLWHTSDPNTEISFRTPISYFDRLRIRLPGDATFALGPHIDGGSVERWEDPDFRACFHKILKGRGAWKEHDPFDATPRIVAKQDLYHAPNQCSIFRPWQGWTSMSTTGPGEGTLRVLPMLLLSSAYIMLRPFFQLRPEAAPNSLDFNDWQVNLQDSSFPGSAMGKTQELNESTHPHLKLDRTMTSIPSVEPGDQVYWHCDVVHAVEVNHRGSGDSSVLYIPAVPLTLRNAAYLRDQRSNFLDGLPAPDFPGGKGESKFVGRGSANDVTNLVSLQMLGLVPFHGDSPVIKKANEILKV